MTKQEEFLWCVQAMIVLDSHNICLDLDPKDRAKISVAGRIETVVYSIRASRRIPDDLSAEKAAHQFFMWLQSFNRNAEENRPTWFPRTELSHDLKS